MLPKPINNKMNNEHNNDRLISHSCFSSIATILFNLGIFVVEGENALFFSVRIELRDVFCLVMLLKEYICGPNFQSI